MKISGAQVVGSGASGVSLAASTTLNKQQHEGRTLSLAGTGSAFTQTLPAATGSGDRYRFVVGAVNTSNHVISAGAGIFSGALMGVSTGDTPDLGQPWQAGATDDTITLNGTTTGGADVGDYVEVEDIAAGVWQVSGQITQSGTEATPFSTA